MINFATVGTNFVVDWFLEAASQCDSLKYKGTYSRNIEKAKEFGEKYGSTLFFDDLDKLAKCDSIDAVYIASPTSFHFEQALKMIENRKHVFVEKPMASNSREVEILIEKANENNVVLIEGMRPVYDDGFKAVEKAIEKIAPVRRASFKLCQYSSRYNKFKNGIVENAFNPKFSNGAIMDIGVYCVHPMVKLFGMPEQIDASAIILPDSIDGEGTISLKYKDMLADITYSKISNGFTPSEIQGEKGAILIEAIDCPRRVIVRYNDGTTEEVYNVELDNNLVFEAKEWETMINSHDYSDNHSKYSLMALEIMDKARAIQGIVFPADKKH